MEPTVLSKDTINHGRMWTELLAEATQAYLEQNVREGQIGQTHLEDTPWRFVRAMQHYVSGCQVDPRQFLEKQFEPGKYDEMVHVRSIRSMSMCAHHLCPVVGKVHFAYVPDSHVVGLSKIPRMVDALSRRPQVQELLTEQIVDTFMNVVKPKGCAVFIRAYHFCMLARGVEEHTAYTETTALRGVFKTDPNTRNEFITSFDRTETIFP